MQRQQLFRVADHSKRGSAFEDELNAVHEYYLLRGIVDMVKNPSAWIYAGEAAYQKGVRANPGAVARDGNGRPMIRQRSNIDFSGGNGSGPAFCFDAKETKGKTFPLSNVHAHQIVRLRRSASCGTCAGIMIKFTDLDRVFFIPVGWLEVKYENWQKQTGRRATPGTASVSIAECEEHGEEVAKLKINGLWDWYAVLTR